MDEVARIWGTTQNRVPISLDGGVVGSAAAGRSLSRLKAEAAAQMVPVAKLPRLPFNHNEIVVAALAQRHGKAGYSELPRHLMAQ